VSQKAKRGWEDLLDEAGPAASMTTDYENEGRPKKLMKQGLSSNSTPEKSPASPIEHGLPEITVQAETPKIEDDGSELSDIESEIFLMEESPQRWNNNYSGEIPGREEAPETESGESELSDLESQIFQTEEQDPSPTIDMSVIHGPSDTSHNHSKPISEFPYRRLNAGLLEIRVVTLMPGLKSAPIVCQIDHVVADRTSDDYEKGYNALSYTWGSHDTTRKISLQGIIVQVRENLWQADHFRIVQISVFDF
jgi:hypothetical protein